MSSSTGENPSSPRVIKIVKEKLSTKVHYDDGGMMRYTIFGAQYRPPLFYTPAEEGIPMPANPNHILKQWESFASACKLENAPEIQLREMKRAFFGGATAMMSTMMRALENNDPDNTTEGELKTMDWIATELLEFGKNPE